VRCKKRTRSKIYLYLVSCRKDVALAGSILQPSHTFLQCAPLPKASCQGSFKARTMGFTLSARFESKGLLHRAGSVGAESLRTSNGSCSNVGALPIENLLKSKRRHLTLPKECTERQPTISAAAGARQCTFSNSFSKTAPFRITSGSRIVERFRTPNPAFSLSPHVGSCETSRSRNLRCSSNSSDSERFTTQGTVSDGGAAAFENLLDTRRKPRIGLEVEELKLDAERKAALDERFGDEETREDAAALAFDWRREKGEKNSKGSDDSTDKSQTAGQKQSDGLEAGSGGSGSAGSVPPPDDVFYVVKNSKDAGVDYLGESTKFDMNMRDIRTPWLRELHYFERSLEKSRH
jgi:hypothetical protein